MSRIKVDRITDKAGTGAPILVNGMNVTGKSTMGDIVGAAATFNSITGGSANFSSDVSIGGTLTYEDVKNVDSVGLITARSGIDITAGDLNAASNLILKVDGTERVRTTTAGNVGINDNNPANQLVVKAPGGSGHCAAKVLSGDASTAMFLQSIQGSEGRLGIESNHPLALYAGTAERLRIGTAGQIGINGANYGTSGQVMTSQGASSAPQWADAGGGAWEFLSSVSNPNTSTVDFTGLTTAYAAYKVHFMGASINTNNVREMRCRIYLNGSLKTGSEYQQLTSIMSVGSNSASSGYGGVAGAILLSGAGNGARGYNGELTFPMKLRTTGAVDSLQAFYGKCISHDYSNTIGGFHNNSYSTLLTGIQFDSPDNYNVTDGQFYLYGLKRS